jgi:hypothetical protein
MVKSKWIMEGIILLVALIVDYYLFGLEYAVKITLVLGISIIGFESGLAQANKSNEKGKVKQ